jgi:hypothetical protein
MLPRSPRQINTKAPPPGMLAARIFGHPARHLASPKSAKHE